MPANFWAGAMSSYTSAFAFLTRWIIHLCAPGFFFLMGDEIYWHCAARSDSGVSKRVSVHRTVWRDFALFLVTQFLQTPILLLLAMLKPAALSLKWVSAPPPNDESTFYWGLITLSGLGLVMMSCGLMLRFRPWAWLAVSALCAFATNSLLPASGPPGPWWRSILLAPSLSDHPPVLYSVILWLAGSAAGMYFGYWWRSNPDQARKRVWMIGILLLRKGGSGGRWVGKYPASARFGLNCVSQQCEVPAIPCFLAVSLGIDLLLLALLTRLPENIVSSCSALFASGQTLLIFTLRAFTF